MPIVKAADIRAQIAADGRLQHEISLALSDFAASLPGLSDLRVVRVLTRTLEPSWAEHVSFQDEVVFPILMQRADKAPHIAATIGQRQAEHAELAEWHGEVAHELRGLLDGDDANGGAIASLLKNTCDMRNRHFGAEAPLGSALPTAFTHADVNLLEAWRACRPRPLFPFSVLARRRARSDGN
jgi:hypothetical protein